MIKQDPFKKHQPTFNKKIIYKQAKLKEAKTIFSCECGKVYLSFPALYLHSKSNHYTKLTSKMSPDVCRIDNFQGRQTITYFIQTRASTSQEMLSDDVDDKNLKDKFTTENLNYQNYPIANISISQAAQLYFHNSSLLTLNRIFIIRSLLTYINKYHSQISGIKQYVSQIPANFLPLYFNSYFNKFTELSHKQMEISKEQVCIQLIEIYKWLKDSKYTNFECTYNPQLMQ